MPELGLDEIQGYALCREFGREPSAATLPVAGARVIVLDDPMSAVDTQTERHLVENLRPALAGRTVLIATQRLSTVEVADRAVVLDDGVVVESGTPEELLARGGLFTRLFGEEVTAAA